MTSDGLNDGGFDVLSVMAWEVEVFSHRGVFSVSDVRKVLEETCGESVACLAHILVTAESAFQKVDNIWCEAGDCSGDFVLLLSRVACKLCGLFGVLASFAGSSTWLAARWPSLWWLQGCSDQDVPYVFVSFECDHEAVS